MRKTKILATLGPSSWDKEVMFKLAEKVDAFRINFSHANYEKIKEIVSSIKNIEEELHKSIALVGDTKGPEIRTTNKEVLEFKKGDKFSLLNDIGVSEEKAFENLRIGDKLLFDDGKYTFILTSKENGYVIEALGEGRIKQRRKINIPERELNINFLGEKDIRDIEFMKENDFDFIAASFVSSKEDILNLEKCIGEKRDDLKIIAKIENAIAVERIEEIIKSSYGVMVARGDLGVEVPFEKVPVIQKEIVEVAHKYGKIAIIATHMLKSMVNSSVPTRAEVSDVANAVIHGADVLMLSEETAAGNYPIESIEAMDRIIRENEKFTEHKRDFVIDYKDIIAHTAIEMADKLKASLIAPTIHGTTPKKLSRYRPEKTIYVITKRKKTAKHMCLVYGTVPYVFDFDPLLERMEEIKRKVRVDKAVFVFGYPEGNHNTNAIVFA